MKDQDTVDSEDHVLNILFTEVDENANPVENGISKDNSVLVKYFNEEMRKEWLGKGLNHYEIVVLEKAFDEKELEFIMQDLGLDKHDEAARKKHFKIQITKIGILEKRELNEEFFQQLYPNSEIKTEADLRNKVKEEIEAQWKSQSDNQIHDQIYHQLVDHTQVSFPEEFLKRWMKTSGEEKQAKSDEEIEKEFPTFLSQLKWTLITDKIVQENNIQVDPEEIRQFAKQQLFSYMGNSNLSDDQPWVNDYVEKMMKDRKFVEDSYNRVQTQKIFEWAASQVKPTEKEISAEDFTKMVSEHHHHH
jgi:trigger factor